MGLINKDILNIVNRLVYKHYINIINRYYSGIIVNRPNDSIALRVHGSLVTLNWRNLSYWKHLKEGQYRYIYNLKYKKIHELPRLY